MSLITLPREPDIIHSTQELGACRRYCSSPHQSLHRPLPEHSSTDRPLSAACPVPSASNVVTESHVFSHALDDGLTLAQVLQRIGSMWREEVSFALYIKGEVKKKMAKM